MKSVTPDLASLISASSKNFNRARDLLRSRGQNRPTLRNVQITSRSLQGYDLNELYFFNCSFDEVSFGNLSNVNFNNCHFSKCAFSPDLKRISAGQEPMLSDVIFFKSSLDGDSFDRQTLKDVQFAQLEMKRVPSFKGALFDGYFIYEDDLIERDLLIAFSEADTSPRSLVQIIGDIEEPLLTWEKIRFVGKLPFLQISLVGVTSLAVLASVLWSVDSAQTSLELECKELASNLAGVSERISTFCENVVKALPSGEVLSSLRNTFIGLSAIFVGALVQTVACPEEISEFSRARWVRQLRRPKEFYIALATKHQRAVWLASCLQATGVAFFAYKAIRAFLTPFL